MVLNVSDWYEKGLYLSIILIILGIIVFMISGCIHAMDRTTPIVIESLDETSLENTIIINLPPGKKLQTINWERTSNNRRLWILTRPMHQNEIPEIYKYFCIDSNQAYEIHESEIGNNEMAEKD